MKIALIGFGNVGQGMVEMMRDDARTWAAQHGLNLQLVAVVTRSRGSLYDPNGLDPAALLRAAQAGSLAAYPHSPTLARDWDTLQIVRQGGADVLVEATPSDLETGQPALHTVQAAIAEGMHVVLANKGPAALAYPDLQQAARAAGVHLRLEATVMAGTPAIATASDLLTLSRITAARGILNGTTNYILSKMHTGLSYADALQQAQDLGYAETDPAGDVEGWDAAGKVLILAAVLFGSRLKMADLHVEGISGLTSDEIRRAEAGGSRYKLVAHVEPSGGSVRLQPLPLHDPLATIDGATNALVFKSDILGDVTLSGPGAGRRETGYALLADLLAIHRASQS